MNYMEGEVLRLNKLAMDFLKYDRFKECLLRLKQAEELLESNRQDALLSITYNNLGCYYKRRKQYKVALEYLQRALSIEEEQEAPNKNRASTHLNISALFSAMSRHNQALWHINKALELLNSSEEKDNQVSTSLAISYFNAGAELEHMNCISEAVKYYEMGWESSVTSLGPVHPMSVNLKIAYRNAKTRMEHISSKLEDRQFKRNKSRVSPHRVPRRFLSNVEKLPAITARPSIVKIKRSKAATPAKSLDFRMPQAIDYTKYIV